MHHVMQHYTLGFLTDQTDQMVALIHKTHPVEQAGLLNGIGGKLESGEEIFAGMRREFLEETGESIHTWCLIDTIRRPTYIIYVFAAFCSHMKVHLKSTTEEIVGWYHMDDLNQHNTVPGVIECLQKLPQIQGDL